VDDLISGVKWLAGYWHIGVAVGVTAAGWFRYGKRHCTRVVRSLALSDRLHEQFGEDTAKKLANAIHEACIEGAIREVRVILIEQAIGSKVYVCSSTTGDCTYANSELAEFFGMDAADFAGNGWLRAIDKSERQEVFEAWKSAVQNNMPYESEYTVVNQRTHERTKCRSKAYPAKLKSGELVWYVGTVEEIE
jgi:PAS domain-containing protein